MRAASAFLILLLLPASASAYINQVDGTIVPQSPRMQQCLDRAGTGETMAGAVDAVVDAAVLPEAFRPVERPAGSGLFPVTFQAIGEGAGYRNNYGWFWIGDDVTNTANLHQIFDCRTGPTCNCPCDPTTMRLSDGSPQSHLRTIEFSTQPGFMRGRPIGFWLRTPELLNGMGNDADNCGNRTDTANRIYFTSKALNDDGDYVHFLVYRSATRTNTFYFGFEDLFRGGDNDFEDMLVRGEGLVPLCDPRPETCNNADDDCDSLIDEGVTMACSTACGAGMRTCVAGAFGACSARTPAAESCNSMDDDCDTRVDEGLSRACMSSCGAGTEVCVAGRFADCNAPTPTIETCNDRDDDCDSMIDEGITRACASACGSGTETCTRGVFGGCTAPTPGMEVCDGDDDDCDGLVDEGITRPCSTACGSGTETCISGMFVGCTAPTPRLEACNNADDDCDAMIDEGLTRACSTACGVGSERCVAGSFVGCDAPTPTPEVCNNVDDDCNGAIDDGNPGGGEACVPREGGGFDVVPEGGGGDGGMVCMPGRVRCVAGELLCQGSTSGTREICNCEDDDCDTNVDEDMGGTLCPGGACVGCTCVSPCADGEFPCPPGRECDRSLADPSMGILGFCVPGRCAGVMCPEDQECDPSSGMCIDLCAGRMCPDGFACFRGACVEDNCYGRGCPTGERCRDGACQADPCAEVSCSGETFCSEGVCTPVCPSTCPEGEECRLGVCSPRVCTEVCSDGESCIAGACVENDCTPPCGRGRVCRGTECVDDPCAGVRCPGTATCRNGECRSGDEPPPPPPDPHLGLAAGGGGCACDTTGGASTSGWWLALAVGAFLLLRRRRAAKVAVGAAMLVAGCDVEPYCFGDCDRPADAGVVDTGVDAQAPDGCVASGEEICDGIDQDCNGIVDDGFDLQNDPAHCGDCETECNLPHAFPDCTAGECVIETCELGWHDIDGVPANGCEYNCPPSGAEECNLLDDDCDTTVDEGFDLATDLTNCGECGTFCSYPNAAAMCVGGICRMGDCNAGFVDLDGMDVNGCEYACTPTGAEMCNEVDDNCDGEVDEGFDLLSDPLHCGTCANTCSFPHAVESCMGGMCGIATCDAGFEDIDGNPITGCEYMCTAAGAESCNGRDDDCNGAVDEADPMLGTACGMSTGACEPGRRACVLGSLTCLGDRGPTPETCNSIDDDCDGTADNGMIAGTGVRCGPSNVGRCRFGTVSCTGGALVCGGAFVGPIAETCNGVDDDCDGTTDDSPAPPGMTPPSCTLTLGVCAGRTPICMGAAGYSCTFPATYQTVETICDGLNNDCDATTDEGCLVPAPASDVRVDLGDAVGAANSIQPYLAGDGAARLYAAWMDRRLGPAHVYFNRSGDSGNTWASGGTPAFPFLIDTAGGHAIGPAIAVTDGGRDVDVVWSDFRGGTSYREIFSRFDNNFGQTWTPADLRINPGQNTDSFGIDVAVEGTNNVHVVYENIGADGRSRHIFYARSTNGGSSWEAPLQVDNGVGMSFVAAQPQVAAAGANVYVIWRDNRNGALDVFVDRSTTRGAAGSFTGVDRRLDVGSTAGAASSFSPAIAAEGMNVHAAYVDDRDGGSFDIWTNVSRDGGASWLVADVRIDADPLRHDSIEPRVVAPAAGRAVVAWIDYRHGFADIFAARTNDAAATWQPPVRLDTSTMPGTSSSLDMELGASGDRIAAAWTDDRSGLLDIYANFSLDGGANWQPRDYRMDTTAMPGTSDSEDPAIFVTPTAAHVIWVDHRSGANGDIYFRRLQ